MVVTAGIGLANHFLSITTDRPEKVMISVRTGNYLVTLCVVGAAALFRRLLLKRLKVLSIYFYLDH